MVRLMSLLLPAAAAAWRGFPDTSLNFSQVASSLPETTAVYLGSPSILHLPGGLLVASHDFFGAGKAPHNTAASFVSSDQGQTWTQGGACPHMYWATLFNRPGVDSDATVYLLGTGDDGSYGSPSPITLARSTDAGATWEPAVVLAKDGSSYSTGPTPVLAWGGRLWRAFEHNTGPGWASGYAALLVSAPADAPNLMDPTVWTQSGELPFSSVSSLVPPAWTAYAAAQGVTGGPYGWLEGNAVQPANSSDPGVHIMLRVNTLPYANVAALLHVASPSAMPTFVRWLDPFPGGMTKFSVRRDGPTGLYVSLTNNVSDPSVSLPPTCGPVAVPSKDLPCCGFMPTCAAGGEATCKWCHAQARNVLTLTVAPAPGGPWSPVAVLLADDTGVPSYLSELQTGFQYVDWQFDGPGGANIIAAVRAGYRGANCYHNANRLLFKTVPGWRDLVPGNVMAP